MVEDKECMTVFRTHYGHLEYTVMSFSLTIPSVTFQHFVNNCFQEFLNHFCTSYLEDILIYSDTLEEHKVHGKKSLTQLWNNKVLSILRNANLIPK